MLDITESHHTVSEDNLQEAPNDSSNTILGYISRTVEILMGAFSMLCTLGPGFLRNAIPIAISCIEILFDNWVGTLLVGVIILFGQLCCSFATSVVNVGSWAASSSSTLLFEALPRTSNGIWPIPLSSPIVLTCVIYIVLWILPSRLEIISGISQSEGAPTGWRGTFCGRIAFLLEWMWRYSAIGLFARQDLLTAEQEWLRQDVDIVTESVNTFTEMPATLEILVGAVRNQGQAVVDMASALAEINDMDIPKQLADILAILEDERCERRALAARVEDTTALRAHATALGAQLSEARDVEEKLRAELAEKSAQEEALLSRIEVLQREGAARDSKHAADRATWRQFTQAASAIAASPIKPRHFARSIVEGDVDSEQDISFPQVTEL